MKLFLRTMLITWAVMTLLAVIAISWPSVLTPVRERTIPMHALEACAKQATPCPNGRFIASSKDVTTDLSGHPLSRSEIHMMLSIEQGQEFVIRFSPDTTAVAFRVDPHDGHGDIYLANVPAPQPFFRHLGALSPVFIAGFLSLFVAAYIVRPLTRLNAAAEEFGAGDLTVRIHSPLVARKDELGDLARTFNAMAEKIETLVARYKDFLAHASHELASPLTRLNIALALAQRKAGPHLEDEHDRISQESHRLNSLVQELLLLARLESGNEVNKESTVFDVRSVVEEAHADALFESQQLQKTVAIEILQDFRVDGYPALLHRAIENVLRNALRFSKAHIAIQVTRSEENQIGIIVIRDDGPGIESGQEETIFEPFMSLSGSGSTGVDGGSGLGLAIARQAVLANAGKIAAHTPPEGGLVVKIELPAS